MTNRPSRTMKRLYSSMYGAAIALPVVRKLFAHTTPSLKETFKNEFLIGTALNSTQIGEKGLLQISNGPPNNKMDYINKMI